MSADGNAAPVIVKRKKVTSGGHHHGGAWKVAYADFVTAMMAFFMLMWLLNATTEKQRKGIADYFTPTVAIARISGGGDGALGGESTLSENVLPRQGSGATSKSPTDADAARGSQSAGPVTDPQAEETALRSAEERLKSLGGESEVADEMLQHVVTEVTDEGLRIEFYDTPERPLFDASGAPTPVLARLAEAVLDAAEQLPNPVAIEAHVAASPRAMAQDPAWAESSRRGQAVRALLAAAGLEESRVQRVTAHGDREPAFQNPMAVMNNRIEVIFLRRGPGR